MPSVTYFPRNDTQLLAWLNNFASKLTLAPTTYGVTAAQCTALSGYISTFQTCLQACQPDIRSKASTTAKNAARDVVKYNAKLMANIVYGQANVTDTMKQQLGLTVYTPPTPSKQPGQAVVEIVSVSGWTVKLKLRDGASAKRGKPKGVSAATIMSYVGQTPPAEASGWKLEGTTSRTDNELLFPANLPAGTKVWITAFWLNGRFLSGPAATPISTNLQGGQVNLAA